VTPDGPWVLDTSVVAAWFFVDDAAHSRSLMIRAAVRDEPARFVVPSLFHAELIHVLARKSGRDAKFVTDALGLVLRLGIRTIALREAALLRAGHWACRGLSGYDATFVALAEDLAGRWLTADDRAARTAGTRLASRLAAWDGAPRAR